MVQRRVAGKIEEVHTKDKMVAKIQMVTEKWFNLVHSAPITMSPLAEKLGYLSDTQFAMDLLDGRVDIPKDVPATTALVL